MAVEAIGSELSSTTTELAKSSLGQEDFIKLFLTELTFQDPLEPINNREFLAQMAQFANLEQTRITNENTNNLVSMNATGQSLDLLGRQAQIETTSGDSVIGTITAIAFSSTGPVLTVAQSNGSVVTDVRLSQIKLVRQGL
jgi:flagellar basal-body rod modification protein FlgD